MQVKFLDHSYRSVEIIKESGIFSESFLDIISHHHENLDGTGFPSGLKGSKIHQVGNLLNFSYQLLALILHGNMDLAGAATKVLAEQRNAFCSKVVDAAEKLVGVNSLP